MAGPGCRSLCVALVILALLGDDCRHGGVIAHVFTDSSYCPVGLSTGRLGVTLSARNMAANNASGPQAARLNLPSGSNASGFVFKPPIGFISSGGFDCNYVLQIDLPRPTTLTRLDLQAHADGDSPPSGVPPPSSVTIGFTLSTGGAIGGDSHSVSISTGTNAEVVFAAPVHNVSQVSLSFGNPGNSPCGVRVELYEPCAYLQNFAGNEGDNVTLASKHSSVTIGDATLTNVDTTAVSLFVNNQSTLVFSSVSFGANIKLAIVNVSTARLKTWVVHMDVRSSGTLFNRVILGNLPADQQQGPRSLTVQGTPPALTTMITADFVFFEGKLLVNNIYLFGTEWDCDSDLGVQELQDGSCVLCGAPAEYQDVAGAKVCKSATDCPMGKTELAPATFTTDRTCKDCDPGTFKNFTGNSPCIAVRNCNAGEAEEQPPTTTSDRVCEACNASVEFSTTTNAPVCTGKQTCEPGMVVDDPGTAKLDRSCASCQPGTFTNQPNRMGCTAHKDCQLSEFESQPGSATSDRACTACHPTCRTCTNGDADDQCTSCFNTATTSVLTEPERFFHFGQCVNPCPPGFFANATAGLCVAVSPECVVGTTYQSAAPTNTTDRVCSVVTECQFSTQYQASPPTKLKDRNCTTLTACSAGQFVAAQPTQTSDRSCQDCAAGTTDHDNDPENDCLACGKGHFAPEGSSGPCDGHECHAGEIDDDEDAATACRDCTTDPDARGLYLEPRASCDGCGCNALEYRCAPGKFDDDQDPSSQCSDCDPGSDSVAGQTSCSTCPTGTVDISVNPLPTDPNDGRCTECPVGSHGGATSLEPCEACNSTEYQNATGQADCIPCTPPCSAGQVEASSCTRTSNRVCVAASGSSGGGGGTAVAAAGAGAAIVILVLILVVIMLRRKRSKNKTATAPTAQGDSPVNQAVLVRTDSALIKDIEMFEPVDSIRNKKKQRESLQLAKRSDEGPLPTHSKGGSLPSSAIYAKPGQDGDKPKVVYESVLKPQTDLEDPDMVDPSVLDLYSKIQKGKGKGKGKNREATRNAMAVNPAVLYASIDEEDAVVAQPEAQYSSLDDAQGQNQVHYGNLGDAAAKNKPELLYSDLDFQPGRTSASATGSPIGAKPEPTLYAELDAEATRGEKVVYERLEDQSQDEVHYQPVEAFDDPASC